MWSLKNLPLSFDGELHTVRLINFSVPLEEVINKVPNGIKVRSYKGRALISMVDVNLKKMHPIGFPGFVKFGYRHIGFRLLVEDTKWNKSETAKGIYFLDSFTNKNNIAWAGELTSHFRLKKAHLFEIEDGLNIQFREKWMQYLKVPLL
ncbi:MAG: hypothetical protein ACI959_000896 [Limisphaerales bacterium]|jgi:uncharacterized protein YqjF (DUF2071 family)